MSDVLTVDKYNLDKEWQKQPLLRMEAGEDASKALQEYRDKKAYAKYRRAQIAFEYRSGKETALDVDGKALKITDKALDAILDSQDELYNLDLEISELQKKADICSAFCTALDQKKYAIQDEVKLYLSGYFSEPVDTTGGGYKERATKVQAEMDGSEERNEMRRRRRQRSEN